jgi:hypothetical protein
MRTVCVCINRGSRFVAIGSSSTQRHIFVICVIASVASKPTASSDAECPTRSRPVGELAARQGARYASRCTQLSANSYRIPFRPNLSAQLQRRIDLMHFVRAISHGAGWCGMVRNGTESKNSPTAPLAIFPARFLELVMSDQISAWGSRLAR